MVRRAGSDTDFLRRFRKQAPAPSLPPLPSPVNENTNPICAPFPAVRREATPFGLLCAEKVFLCMRCFRWRTFELFQQDVIRATCTPDQKGPLESDAYIDDLARREGWAISSVRTRGNGAVQHMLCPDCVDDDFLRYHRAVRVFQRPRASRRSAPRRGGKSPARYLFRKCRLKE